MRTPIRDKNNKQIGYIYDDGSNYVRLYDHLNAFKGQYNKSNNTTYDSFGNYYGTGDQLNRLLN